MESHGRAAVHGENAVRSGAAVDGHAAGDAARVDVGTDFVVVGSLVNGGRVKEQRAEDLNIPLIPESEWDDIVACIRGAKAAMVCALNDATQLMVLQASAPTKRHAASVSDDDDDEPVCCCLIFTMQ